MENVNRRLLKSIYRGNGELQLTHERAGFSGQDDAGTVFQSPRCHRQGKRNGTKAAISPNGPDAAIWFSPKIRPADFMIHGTVPAVYLEIKLEKDVRLPFRCMASADHDGCHGYWYPRNLRLRF